MIVLTGGDGDVGSSFSAIAIVDVVCCFVAVISIMCVVIPTRSDVSGWLACLVRR